MKAFRVPKLTKRGIEELRREKKFLESLTQKQKERRKEIMNLFLPLRSIRVMLPTSKDDERIKRANKLMEKLLDKYSVEEIVEVLTERERREFMERYRRYKKEGIASGIIKFL